MAREKVEDKKDKRDKKDKQDKKDKRDKRDKRDDKDEEDEQSAAQVDPANLPGVGIAREAVNLWGQLLTANVDSYNEMWSEMRQGKVSLKSLLSRSAGTIQRSVEDIGQLIRSPLVDTDRPDWAIFWYDVGITNDSMVKPVALGRRYPSTLELHRTDLQMLGREESIDASHYSATLAPDGRTLIVQLDEIHGKPRLGDYVGLVTAEALQAPLAVVMVTVRDMGPPKKKNGNGARRNQQGGGGRRKRGGAAGRKPAAAKAK